MNEQDILKDVVVREELKELFHTVRKFLGDKSTVKVSIPLVGKLLDCFNAFTDKKDIIEDSAITEVIGTHFWDLWFKEYPEHSNQFISLRQGEKDIIVHDITNAELDKDSSQILEMAVKSISALVGIAMENSSK